jgi:hypothetical protein
VDCGDDCEVCDDGNNIGGDFCSADCAIHGWHTFYGSSNYDYGYSVAVDGDGDVYVTGGAYGAWNGPAGELPLHAFAGGGDIAVLKLSPSGEYQWHTFFGAGGAAYDFAYSLAVDADGDVYVTGYAAGSWNGPTGELPLHPFSGSYDLFVLKLDSEGAYQWHTFFGAGTYADYGRSIAVDGSGNAWVTGYSYESWNGPAGELPLHAWSGSYDLFVVALDADGGYVWHTFLGGASSDSANAITVHGGNAYVAGYSYDNWTGPAGQAPLHAWSGSYDLFVVALSAAGAYQWHTFYGSAASYEYGNSVAVDGSGNVYVSGDSYGAWNGPTGQLPLHAKSGSTTYGDAHLLKLSSSGAYQWHTFHGGDGADSGSSVALDATGNPYLTGYSSASWNGPVGQSPLHAWSGGYDLHVLSLTAAGAYQWHTFYGSAATYEYGASIAVDGPVLYAAGYSNAAWWGADGESPLCDFSGGSDLTVLKLAR